MYDFYEFVCSDALYHCQQLSVQPGHHDPGQPGPRPHPPSSPHASRQAALRVFSR